MLDHSGAHDTIVRILRKDLVWPISQETLIGDPQETAPEKRQAKLGLPALFCLRPAVRHRLCLSLLREIATFFTSISAAPRFCRLSASGAISI